MSELDRPRNLSTANVAPAPDAISQAASPSLWLAGSSAAITQLRGQVRRVAPYFRTALLTGEPGCGEDALAHLLHQLCPLSQRPFVNLASARSLSLFSNAHPAEALASVGMFYTTRPDLLSTGTQTALLHLIRKYGPQTPRIVAFAERGLRPLVSANGFSAELADTLGALRIVVPPLRDRREDVPQLLATVMEAIVNQSGVPLPELAPDLLDAARALPWRGNLAQLYSAADGLIQRAARRILHATDLDAVLGSLTPSSSSSLRDTRLLRLDDVIQEHIRSVLLACNGNKLRTAEALGISRSTLYRMLESPTHPSPLPTPAFDSSSLCMPI